MLGRRGEARRGEREETREETARGRRDDEARTTAGRRRRDGSKKSVATGTHNLLADEKKEDGQRLQLNPIYDTILD
jgi:hypothetical protein